MMESYSRWLPIQNTSKTILSWKTSRNTLVSTRDCCASGRSSAASKRTVFSESQARCRYSSTRRRCSCARSRIQRSAVCGKRYATVLCCDEEIAYGEWGAGAGTCEWLGPFKDAARTIAGDERAPMEWCGRYAVRAVLVFGHSYTDWSHRSSWRSLRRRDESMSTYVDSVLRSIFYTLI